MLLWSGLVLLALGAACFAIDRRAVHAIHDHLSVRVAYLLHRTTDWAKGGHWLVVAIVALIVERVLRWIFGPGPALHALLTIALAFLASLAIGSAILHATKIILGRRRPRDELELGLYGFRPFRFDLQYDSFPSGHALTIFCVAAIATGALPLLAPLWFAIALYLSLTRALLNAHFFSDVFVGAGLGLLTAREVVLLWFPALARPWF
jgi:membrane-associated phospholipid phosphatase